ncbi:MAG TPA: response regulator, partial [Accumulibacter sp.]|nr:response regulator [Accumulibacter sp.]
MTAKSAPAFLIVDDSRMSRMMIAKYVSQLRPAWSLLEASSGEEALAMIAVSCPDLISMDVNMPGMNGLQAAS